MAEEIKYHPEPYWSDVAKRIASRENENVVAGDDEPYYRYKRKEFLNLLEKVDFSNKSVLEIGSGPGGNIKFIFDRKPSRLVGVDISQDMITLARSNNDPKVEFYKINGTQLPFADQEFDIVFSATVLQHNTDESMMQSLLGEMARVSNENVFLFERIEDTVQGDDLCKGRPVDHYAAFLAKYNFELHDKEFINIRASYYISGAIRKGLNSSKRKEGEPLNNISVVLQNLTLPITKMLDKVFTSTKDIARLGFRRKK